MSELYDVVKRTIDASSIDEANDLLFGIGGTTINSDEYYETVVSSFIKRKEVVIRKVGTELIFDLDNVNDLWSCVFIGEYVRHEIEEMEDDINKQLISIQNDISNIDKEYRMGIIDGPEKGKRRRQKDNEKRLLNQKLNDLASCKTGFFDQTNSLRVKLENSTGVEEKDLEKVKEDIKSIHIIRNTIQHGKSDSATIENYNTEIKIPIEYLEGFNKGRIIARDKDKVVVQKANAIISPILEAKDYDIKKVESFFYQVDPEYLDFLLEQVNYDYDELYKINYYIFDYKNPIESLVKDYKISFNDIRSLPLYAFHQKSAENIAKLFKNYDVSTIKKFKEGAFFHPDSIPILLKKLSIDDLTKLPDYSFAYPNEIVKLLDYFGDINYITKLDSIAFKNADEIIYVASFFHNTSLENFPFKAIQHPSTTMKLLKYLKPEEICEIPENAWYYWSNLESIVKNIDFKILKHLQPISFKYPHITFNLINERKMSIPEINRIPENLYHDIEKLLDRYTFEEICAFSSADYKYLDNQKEWFILRTRLSDQVIKELPDWAFVDPTLTFKIYDKIGLKELKKLDLGNVDKELLLKLFDKYDARTIKLISEYGYYFLANTMKYLEDYGIEEVKSFCNQAFSHPEAMPILIDKFGVDNLKRLPNAFFENPELSIKLLNKYSIDEISQIPIYFVEKNFNEDFINRNIDLTRLPSKLFSMDVKIDNLKRILQIVDNDYDKLKEYPIECFTCNVALIDEVLKKYNSNVARSIFGINNPKIIGTLIYCNSVFKNYDGIPKYYNEIDIDASKFMNMCISDTYRYRNNFDAANKKNNIDFTKQFTEDENGNIMDSLSMKKKLLKKLRNSTAHYRFKPVKDENGNIIPNKVYLYDKFDESTDNNFNLVIDIEYLIKIARTVELGIKMADIKEKIDESNSKVDQTSRKFYFEYESGNRFKADEELEKWDTALEMLNTEEARKKDIEEKISHIR